MAAKQNSADSFKAKSRTKRPGIHSKNKTSKLKGSSLYKKSYKGQG